MKAQKEVTPVTSHKVRDQAYIKQSNIHAVLKTLRDEQPVSRKDIIGITRMSPTSITRIVGTLLDSQLIVEGPGPESMGRGRKAVLLRTNPDGLYTLGFLVDRDYIRACVHDFDGHTLYSAEQPLPRAIRTADEVAGQAHRLYKAIPQAVFENPARLQGIGVSTPGIIDSGTGEVLESIQMHWRQVDLQGAFERVFGLPTWVENDVKAALIGEKDRLGIPRQTDAAYLYLGESGIGLSMTAGGELLRGEGFAAGEVAHVVLSPSDLACDCGQYGCLQLHLVETYLIRRAQKIDPQVQSMEGIAAAYLQRLAWAEVLIGDFKRHLLLVIALLDSFCNPAKIIISGDILKWLTPMLDDVLSDPHLLTAPDFRGASVRGTAIIAMQHTLSRRLAGHEAV